MGAASQFRGQMETLVKSTLEDAKRDKEIALETLRVESQDGLESQERTLRQEFDDALNRVRESEAAEREVLASKREALYQTSLQQGDQDQSPYTLLTPFLSFTCWSSLPSLIPHTQPCTPLPATTICRLLTSPAVIYCHYRRGPLEGTNGIGQRG